MREEVLCATADVAPLTEVRSTLLGSSFLSLKERGLEARYLANLPPELHDVIRFTPAGVWLPVAVGRAHYAACDALGLCDEELRGMGNAVAKLATKSMVTMAIHVAGAAGVDPWSILGTTDRYWGRLYRGSGVVIAKTGPKDGRFDVIGNPLSRFLYWRVALGGIIHSVTSPFCRTMYVREVVARHPPDGASYSVSWA